MEERPREVPTACLKKHLFRLIDNVLNKVYKNKSFIFLSDWSKKENLFLNVSSEDFVCSFIYFIYFFIYLIFLLFPSLGMLQEEHSCSYGQQALLCYQATPPYCVTLYNSQSKQECWIVCVCVCARMYVCIRETGERQKTSQLDAEESLFESLMIFALGKRWNPGR